MSDITNRISEIEDILTKITEKNSSITGINEYVSKLESGLAESLLKHTDQEMTPYGTLTKSKEELDESHTIKYDIQEKKHHLNTKLCLLMFEWRVNKQTLKILRCPTNMYVNSYYICSIPPTSFFFQNLGTNSPIFLPPICFYSPPPSRAPN